MRWHSDAVDHSAAVTRLAAIALHIGAGVRMAAHVLDARIHSRRFVSGTFERCGDPLRDLFARVERHRRRQLNDQEAAHVADELRIR